MRRRSMRLALPARTVRTTNNNTATLAPVPEIPLCLAIQTERNFTDTRFELAKQLGATDCLDPAEHAEPIQRVLVKETQWGVDYTFDCTGNTEVMRAALEAAHRGWGVSCVIGVAAAGQEISTRPFQLVTGRKWVGTAFGGVKSRDGVPELVQEYMQGDLPLDHFVSERYQGLASIPQAIEAMHGGKVLRAVVTY